MTYRLIQVEPLSPHVGAEISGVDRHCEIGRNLAGRNQPDAEPGMKQAVKPERDQESRRRWQSRTRRS